MKWSALHAAICGCLLWPVSAEAQVPSYGIERHEGVSADFAQEKHPRKSQIAVAVTEELGLDGAPLSFHIYYESWLGGDHPLASKGKVILQVTISRGDEVLWTGKRRVKVKDGDTRHVFCDAYDQGLQPGDIVLFTFTFRGLPRLGEIGGFGLLGQVGTMDMWDMWANGALFQSQEVLEACVGDEPGAAS